MYVIGGHGEIRPGWPQSIDHVPAASAGAADLDGDGAAEIVALGRRPGGVVYAVPGHPLMGESSVARILAQAGKEGLAVRIVEGLSFVEPTLSLLRIDGLDGLQLADATDLAAAPTNPDAPRVLLSGGSR